MGNLSDNLRTSLFYGILDTGYVKPDMMFAKCRQLLDSGTSIIQLRAKKESAQQRRDFSFEILPLFKGAKAYFIINDDIALAEEICAIIPNAGLHIGQDDADPKEARARIGENRVLGLSTHSIEQATAADALSDTLDYFAVGPVFATQTKPGRQAVGLDFVSAVRAMNPTLPWFAIGGVNLKTASQVRQAGAERIVAVSDVLLPPDTTQAVSELVKNFLGK